VADPGGSATEGLFSVAGKTVVVTGGGRGIGEMIAGGFVRAGAGLVVIASRKAEQLEETAVELSRLGPCVAIAADLSSQAGAQALAEAVAEHTDRVDVLVNNAGVVWEASLDTYPEAGFDKVFSTNVKGVFFVTQALLELLRAAAGEESPARVINIGSVDALRHLSDDVYAYGASKAAVHRLTRDLAGRLAAEAITVNAIAPGVFPTKLNQPLRESAEHSAALLADIPLGRFGRGSDLFGAAQFLASPAGSYVTGTVVVVDGGVAGCV
jgi:NAD(P)-dependent dehydrogenase (short-subunit alcohol dehydrogenase family)